MLRRVICSEYAKAVCNCIVVFNEKRKKGVKETKDDTAAGISLSAHR